MFLLIVLLLNVFVLHKHKYSKVFHDFLLYLFEKDFLLHFDLLLHLQLLLFYLFAFCYLEILIFSYKIRLYNNNLKFLSKLFRLIVFEDKIILLIASLMVF